MEHAYGLYTHIQANRRHSVALLIALFALVYVMVFAGALASTTAIIPHYVDILWHMVTGANLSTQLPSRAAELLLSKESLESLLRDAWRDFLMAWPWATIGTLAWIFIAYRFHQSMIDAITGAYEVTRREQPQLWDLLENLCISRGVTMPKLKVIDNPALNAFASGMNQKQYSITVTSGLIQSLDDAELEAVLGHELTHIRNGDVRLLVIAVVIAGVISFFSDLAFRTFFRSDKGSGDSFPATIIAAGLVAIAWLFSVMIRFALSRRREYLADAGSVELTKNPDAMIMALRKIENRGNLERANSAVMEMCIDNPREEAADLFATHPSIDRRVDALVRFAAGHDPGPIVLPAPEGSSDEPTRPEAQQEQITGASVGGEPVQSGAPFLPSRPPIELGGTRLPAMEEGQSTGARSGSEPPQPGEPFLPNSPLIGLDDTPLPGGEQGKSAAANPGAEPAQPGKPFLPSR